MKSNLLLELQRIVEGRNNNIDFPIPCYLFVQKYGRTIQSELQQITQTLGRENHFFFKAEATLKEETILRRFLLEEERHAGLGKKYTGCVLIELSGEESGKEVYDLLDYLDRHQQRISALFTTRNPLNSYSIRKQLEQFFFVRVIDGAKYEVQEQLTLFEDKLGSYQFELSEAAKEEMKSFLELKEWKESDMVEKRIQNLVSDIVYSRILTEEEENSVIEKEDVIIALQKATKDTEKRSIIGFVIGG
ncbi:MAG: hypothetical protein IJ379_04520 [Lachnospiraceae bacterium]|nr:hypothetical protein [Lachnospiraceae bacterium]